MAVPVSVQQMALTRDTGPGGFMERVTAMLAKVAGIVLSEAGVTPYHQSRAQYSQRVVSDPQRASTQAGPQVVMSANVVNSTTYDEVEKKATCVVNDIDLEASITSLWNALAGIDTPS